MECKDNRPLTLGKVLGVSPIEEIIMKVYKALTIFLQTLILEMSFET